MAKRICLVGVKGIGKTTLIKKLLSKLTWIDYMIGSEVLRNLVGDDFRNFDHYPEEKKKVFREEAIRYMEKRQEKIQKDILVDGHTTLFNPKTNKIECVFTELDCHFFSDLIHFTAPSQIVLERRKTDQFKKRILDLKIIQKELESERKESQRIAHQYQMGWYEIKFNQNQDPQDSLYNLLVMLHERQ